MHPSPSQGGKEGEQWVRVIDGALQEWEAENRTDGRPSKETMCVTQGLSEDGHCSRGIRRRLQKRSIKRRGAHSVAMLLLVVAGIFVISNLASQQLLLIRLN